MCVGKWWYIMYTRVSQTKIWNNFYFVIYWTQKVHNDFIFLCSLHCHLLATHQNPSIIVVNLQDNRAVFRIFIALLKLSFDSPSYLCLSNRRKRKYRTFRFMLYNITRKNRGLASKKRKFQAHWHLIINIPLLNLIPELNLKWGLLLYNFPVFLPHVCMWAR